MGEDYKDSNTRTHTADTRNPDWDKYVPEGQGKTDEQIRADVHDVLLTEGDASQSLSISVQDGIVTLSGKLESSAQQKMIELVRGVPSVKDVQSQLQSDAPVTKAITRAHG